MRRLLIVFGLVLAPTLSASAQTLSTRDVIELSKAGLGEEVLLALIDVNRSVFPVDPETLKTLKDAGVTANVIAAMVRSGRDLAAPPPAIQETAAVHHDDVVHHEVVHHEVVESEGTTTRERELERELERLKDRELELELERSRSERRSAQYSAQYVVPVAVPVYAPIQRFIPADRFPGQLREFHKPVEPVYWGWDGKLRPDAWKPDPREQRDRKDHDRNDQDHKDQDRRGPKDVKGRGGDR